MKNENNDNQILYKSNTESINQKSKLMKMKKLLLVILGKSVIILLISFLSFYIFFIFLYIF